MKRILTGFLLLCFYVSGAQQLAVSGSLISLKGEVVPFASVMIKNAENKVIAYKSSDSKGEFLIVIPSAQQGSVLHLDINHLGFKKISYLLEAGRKHYEIVLEEQSINLADVKVKSRPRLTNIGDTLSYDVGSFAKQEDRSIGDVLKRLPGIEVAESGQVKFNGQEISNLYIDGDDLLDNRYAIGTKTIPYAMVKGVEVLQNHQALKVLKNKVLSDRIAINLVIKEEAKLKLTGEAKLGAGLPRQFDSELNTILFNKKYKVLNVLKGNSIGQDLVADFAGIELGSQMSDMENFRPASLLSTGVAGQPSLPKTRYLLNRSAALSANNLVNLTSGLQLKANVNAVVDKNEMRYGNISEYYFGQDTIRYRESQELVNRPFLAEVSLNGKVNKDQYYFSNSLKFTYSADDSRAELLSDTDAIHQQLSNKVRDFSNALAYVPALRNKNIIRVDWFLNYYHAPQILRIQPGLNADIFNEGRPFAGIRQRVEMPTWFNKASLSYQLTNRMIKQNYRAGVLNEHQELNSRLRISQLDGSEHAYKGSRDNELQWNRNQVFAIGTYEYKKGLVETALTVPVAFQRIGYRDQAFELKERNPQVLFDPSFRLKYLRGAEDYISLNYGYTHQTGEMTDVYRGAILVNYRSLRANDAVLNEQNSHSVGMQYNFRRSISMLFMNAGLSYNRASSNTLASNVVADAISQTVLLALVNKVSSVRASVGMSKYIFALGATANLNASWSRTRYSQLFNETLLPFSNLIFVLNPEAEARLWNQVSMSYQGSATWTTSKLLSKASSFETLDRQVLHLVQNLGLSYSPGHALYGRLSGRHHYSKQPQIQNIHYFFLDAFVRYRVNSWRTDIEMNLSNLVNIRHYESYSLSANQFVYSQYQLRGRMMMVKFVFNL